MQIAPFRIEEFYARHEFSTRYMLSSSDCESWTVRDLLALEADAEDALLSLHCGYTESPGAPELRAAIAGTYAPGAIDADDVLACAAAEEGIFLAYHALLRPGDHVIVETPCYESALTVARSTGAEVSEWKRSYEEGWEHDLDALERLLRPDTRMIYLNEPHNPTGTLMSPATYARVIELAAERGTIVFSDEVYRGLEYGEPLPAICEAYERGISLGSVSKSYGLPGLRTGWLTCRDHELLAALLALKHYTTICSSAPSEQLTALALRHGSVLLERNRGLVARNLPLFDAFLESYSEVFSWVRPTAGPIGFARVADGIDPDELSAAAAAQAGVLLLPGSVYDEPRHVRLGFGRANLPEALAHLDAFLGGVAAPV